jgi:hypothetical protein
MKPAETKYNNMNEQSQRIDTWSPMSSMPPLVGGPGKSGEGIGRGFRVVRHETDTLGREQFVWTNQKSANYRLTLFRLWDKGFLQRLEQNFCPRMLASSKRHPYAPMPRFMKAMRYLMQVKQSFGDLGTTLVWANPNRFNGDDYLVVGREDIYRASEKVGTRLTGWQLRECIAILKRHRILHGGHMRAGQSGAKMYLRFNLGPLLDAMQADEGSTLAPVRSVRARIVAGDLEQFGISKAVQRIAAEAVDRNGVYVAEFHNTFTKGSKNASSVPTHDQQILPVGDSLPVSLPEEKEGTAGAECTFGSPECDLDGWWVKSPVSESQYEIIQYVQDNPVFWDETFAHNELKSITTRELEKLIALTSRPGGLNLEFLKRYFGAGAFGYQQRFHVERSSETWWLDLRFEKFLDTFWFIRRALDRAQRDTASEDREGVRFKVVDATKEVMEAVARLIEDRRSWPSEEWLDSRNYTEPRHALYTLLACHIQDYWEVFGAHRQGVVDFVRPGARNALGREPLHVPVLAFLGIDISQLLGEENIDDLIDKALEFERRDLIRDLLLESSTAAQ